MQEEHSTTTKKSFSVWRLLSGSFLLDGKSMNQLGFVFYIGILAMISIASSHCADDKAFRVSKLSTELRQVRSAYITTKRELMSKTKQSVVEEEVGKLGLEFSDVPPIQLSDE